MKLFYLFALLTLAGSQSPLDVDADVQTSPLTSPPFYLITAPKVLTGVKEPICLVLFDRSPPPEAKIKIRIEVFGTRQALYEIEEPLTAASQCVKISTKDVRVDRALLHVQVPGLVDDVREVIIRPSLFLTLIETSKPVYKPLEIIKFRVLTLDQWLKPQKEEFTRMWIENAKSIPVMEWTDVLSNNGIIAYKLPIAEDNMFGIWKVKLLTKEQSIIEKNFEVNQFTKRKVLFDVITPGYILESDETTHCKVCVRNEFGHPLSGQLKALVKYERLPVERPGLINNMPIDLIVNEIEGCHELVLNRSKLLWNTPYLSQRILKLNLEFTESQTGLVDTKQQDLAITSRAVLIHRLSARLVKQYYKPGLPYFGELLVEHPDYIPAANKTIKVCYEVRETPWIENPTPICGLLTSTSEGVVRFSLPPMAHTVKQVFIRANLVDHPSTENSFSLEPWYSQPGVNIELRPVRQRPLCKEPLLLDVLFSNVSTPTVELYYQVISKGSLEAPKKVQLQTLEWKLQSIQQSLVGGLPEAEMPPILSARLTIDTASSEIPYAPMSRIIVYMLDPEKNLAVGFINFFVDCIQNEDAQMTVSEGADNAVNMEVTTQPASVCALELSTSQQRSVVTKRKIMKLLEKFDLSHEMVQPDRCEQQRLSRMMRRPPYLYGPYSTYALPSIQPPLVDFKSNWDVFNEIGLIAATNIPMDQGPCEADVFPRGVPREVITGFETESSQMRQRISQDDSDFYALKKLEASLMDDLLHWSVDEVPADSDKIAKQLTGLRLKSGEDLYGSALCVNQAQGLHIVSGKLARKVSVIGIRAYLPSRIVLGESLPVKVYIKKTVPGCIPVQVKPHALIYEGSTESAPIQDLPEPICACQDSQVVDMVVYPKLTGKLNLQLIAETPANTSVCENPALASFESKLLQEHVEIVEPGVHQHEYRTKLICPEQQKVHQLRNLSAIKSAHLTSDITPMLFRQIEQSLAAERSAVDLLSAYAPSVYLLSSQRAVLSAEQRLQLQKVMSQAYQALMTFRTPEGAFSSLIGRKLLPDLPLTAATFKVLVQAKREGNHFINDFELRRTLMWIYSRQSQDGCFYSPDKGIDVWPLYVKTPLETTAFVVASLLEAGQDVLNPPINRALLCIRDLTSDDEPPASDIAHAMLAYIEAIKGNVPRTRFWLKRLTDTARVQDHLMYWNATMSKEVAAYTALSYRFLNETQQVKQISRWLLSQPRAWESVITCKALTKLYPYIKPETDFRLTVEGQESPIVLTGIQTHSLPLTSDQLSAEGSGCAFLQTRLDKKIVKATEESFKVSISGLDDGYTSCRKRMLHLCLRSKEGINAISPVVKLQILSGFDIDERVLYKIIRDRIPTLMDNFRIRGRALFLYLKPLSIPLQSYCIDIPFIQNHVVKELKPAYIQIYDYYRSKAASQPMSDVLTYKFPKDCTIVKPIAVVRGENTNRLSRNLAEEADEKAAAELYTFPCPENVRQSCPVCKHEIDHAAEQAICKSDISAIVRRKAFRALPYTNILAPDHEERPHHGHHHKVKKCVAVPLKINKLSHLSHKAHRAVENSANIYLYMLEECGCSYVKDQSKGEGLVVIKDLQPAEGTSSVHQLAEEDHLINLPLGEIKLPKCQIRSKRSAGGEEPKGPHTAPQLNQNHQQQYNANDKNSTELLNKRSADDTHKRSELNSQTKLEEKEKRSQADQMQGIDHKNQSSSSFEPRSAYQPPPYQAPPTYSPPPYSPPPYEAPPTYSPPPYQAPPTYSPPPYSPPPYEAPPTYSPPPYQAPPTYSPPPYSPPPYEAPPPYQAPPTYSPPPYQAPPTYSPPPYSPPPYEAPPTYSPPPYQAPPTYSPPPYSPPPTYSPPPYQAPPTYSPPPYEAPPTYSPPPYQAPPTYSPPPYSPPPYEAPPTYSPPPYQAPTYSPPPYSPPPYEAPPTYSPPPYSPPPYEAPPTYSPPPYQAPTYSPPPYQAPTYSPPPYSPPPYEAPPTYSPPPYQAPTYSPPPYSPPPYESPPTYSPPPYQAPPTYSPPPYSPPPYQAPTYSPPSYSPPPYEAPPTYSPPPYQAPPSYSPPPYEPPKYAPPTMYTSPPPVYTVTKYEKPYTANSGYSSPPPSYSAPAPSYSMPTYQTPIHGSYSRRSGLYGSPPAGVKTAPTFGGYVTSGPDSEYVPPSSPTYPHTETSFVFPQYHIYAKEPGYIRTGYYSAYSKPHGYVHPSYYYGRNTYTGWRGPWYVPAPSKSITYYPATAYGTNYMAPPAAMPVAPKSYSVPANEVMKTAATTVSAVVLKPDDCPTTARTCPICENYVNLDLVSKLCSYKNIFLANIERSAVDLNMTICGEAQFENSYKNETTIPAKLHYSMRKDCECDLVRNGNRKMIIATQYPFKNNSKLSLSESDFVISHSYMNLYDIQRLVKRCKDSNP